MYQTLPQRHVSLHGRNGFGGTSVILISTNRRLSIPLSSFIQRNRDSRHGDLGGHQLVGLSLALASSPSTALNNTSSVKTARRISVPLRAYSRSARPIFHGINDSVRVSGKIHSTGPHFFASGKIPAYHSTRARRFQTARNVVSLPQSNDGLRSAANHLHQSIPLENSFEDGTRRERAGNTRTNPATAESFRKLA